MIKHLEPSQTALLQYEYSNARKQQAQGYGQHSFEEEPEKPKLLKECYELVTRYGNYDRGLMYKYHFVRFSQIMKLNTTDRRVMEVAKNLNRASVEQLIQIKAVLSVC